MGTCLYRGSAGQPEGFPQNASPDWQSQTLLLPPPPGQEREQARHTMTEQQGQVEVKTVGMPHVYEANVTYENRDSIKCKKANKKWVNIKVYLTF